jgi:hypothetical protein
MTEGQIDLEDLVRQTEALAQEVRDNDDVTPAVELVRIGMDDFEAREDLAVDVLLPTEAAAAGFLRVRSPRAFILALICSEQSVREEIRIALNTGPSAVVGTVVGLLTIGAGVAVALSAVSAIAVGIAALLITKGLDGSCAEVSG